MANSLREPKLGNKTKVELSLMIIDSQKEKQLRIGSTYSPPLLHEDECAIHKNVADFLGLSNGTKGYLTFRFTDAYILYVIYNATKYHQYFGSGTEFKKLDANDPTAPWWDNEIKLNCTIIEPFESLGGKLPLGGDEGCMWMELKYIMKTVGKHFKTNDPKFTEFVANTNPEDVSLESKGF